MSICRSRELCQGVERSPKRRFLTSPVLVCIKFSIRTSQHPMRAIFFLRSSHVWDDNGARLLNIVVAERYDVTLQLRCRESRVD